jgi:hypothetical protein
VTDVIRLPSRTGRGGLDGVLGLVSAVLLPLGLGLIVLGWYGAAHTPYLFEQVPYLISGGLVGLGLVTGAGLLYFGSWVARSAAAQQRAGEQMLDLLREIRDGLGERPSPRAASNGNGHHAGGFVATARGSMWHRPDCTVVLGREDLHLVAADGGGLQPCALCQPLSHTAPVS